MTDQAAPQPGPGDPGQVSRSLASSVRHRVVTRARLSWMAPRRRRALRALREGRTPGALGSAAPVEADPRVRVIVLSSTGKSFWFFFDSLISRFCILIFFSYSIFLF